VRAVGHYGRGGGAGRIAGGGDARPTGATTAETSHGDPNPGPGRKAPGNAPTGAWRRSLMPGPGAAGEAPFGETGAL